MTDPSPPRRVHSPTFSLVVPTYRVAAYLPYFLGCLSRQTHPLTDLDPVFVIDGSPDDSAELIRSWADEHAPHSRIVRQENAGLSAARNRGLTEARGRWVTFCDPDDGFDDDYFAEVAAYLAGRDGERTDLVACALWILEDPGLRLVDRHPLRRRFSGRPQLVDLTREPDRLHLQAASGFYRRERVAELGLAFDDRIRPNFEDAHFTARYLWSREHPLIAFLPQTRYHYRKRADGSSLVQQSWARPEKFLDLPEHGYLALARELGERLGRLPLWVQNLLLYELVGYLREEDRPRSALGGVDDAVYGRFHEILAEILSWIDPESIEGFRVVGCTDQQRLALHHAAGGPPAPAVWITAVDEQRQAVRLRYTYAGDPPEERLLSRGRTVEVVWGRHRDVTYLGRTLYRERIAWLSATGTVAVELDGRRQPLRVGPPRPEDFRVGPTALWRTLAGREPPESSSTYAGRPVARDPERGSEPVGGTDPEPAAPRSRRWWQRARPDPPVRVEPAEPVAPATLVRWLLIDSPGQAGGQAEYLFRHLRAERPDLPAAFVLEPGTASWDRLTGEGWPLLAWQSDAHRAALDGAERLISSALDRRAVTPEGWPAGCPYVTLTEGVQVGDQSRLLDRCDLRLLTAGTPGQYRLLTGDGGRGALTDHEVVLTGLAGHDALLDLAGTVSADRLLVARAARTSPPGGGPAPRTPLDDLLADPRLAATARAAGLRLTLLGSDPPPQRCEVLDPAVTDVTTVLAESTLLITDHSPLAFDLAALGRPTCYLQPDGDDYFSGRHGVRRSHWDDALDGFGPVARDASGLIRELTGLLDDGCRPPAAVADRMTRELAPAAGARRRIVTEIERLDQPLMRREAYRWIR